MTRRPSREPVHTPRVMPAQMQVAVSMVVGLVAGVPTGFALGVAEGVLAFWDVTCAVYIAWVWARIWPRSAEETARIAVRADPTRATADVLVLSSAVASLLAVGVVLAHAASGPGGATDTGKVALGLVSVALSWGMVHTIFTLRYARDYFRGEEGGVDFNTGQPPRYSDFAYLAFTIGMTFQVSDTPLQDEVMRRNALRHALLSFVFGTGIIATTVNLVASLTSH